MKTIGMLGGMSWESTALYYRLINEGVKQRLGGLHSARIAMYSVDFHELEALMAADDWRELEKRLCDYARLIEQGGADFLLICTNTMHKMADAVADAIAIPLLHLADATGERVRTEGMNRVGLLGTRVTMEEDFYRGRISARHGLEVLIPARRDREIVNRIIFSELCKGVVREQSRQEYQRIIAHLEQEGAQGIILGCTEICMLIGPDHAATPLFNTTEIHAQAAVKMALS